MRFFDSNEGPANIQLELNTKITQRQVDAFGEDFETSENGFVDFLYWTIAGFRLWFWKLSERARVRWTAKNRHGVMLNP